eukprot:g35694.t1
MAVASKVSLGSQQYLCRAQIHEGGTGDGFGPSMRPSSISKMGLKWTHGTGGVEFELVQYPAAFDAIYNGEVQQGLSDGGVSG